MPLTIPDGVHAEAGAAIGAAKGLDLTLSLRPGDAAGTVRGNPPAANHGIDAAALCQGVFMAHQGDKSAAFARPESRGALVEDAHLFGGESAGFGEADEFEGVEAQIDTARESGIEIAAGEAGASVSDRQQGRGAGPINSVSAAFEIKLIADAPGDGVRETAGQAFFAHCRERGLIFWLQTVEEAAARFWRPAFFRKGGLNHAAHVRPAKAEKVRAGELARKRVANEDARGFPRQSAALRKASVHQRPGSNVQGKPVRQIG